MSTKIGKIQLNFQIVDTDDPRVIILYDFSQWRVIENMPAFVEVTPPGSRKPVVQPFKKRGITAFNSITLGLTCNTACEEELSDLPDGIYHFCLRGGKDGERQLSKYYLKKDKFQVEFDKIIADLPKNYQDTDMEKVLQIVRVKSLLINSEANTREGNISDANDYFVLANRELSKLKECKNCV